MQVRGVRDLGGLIRQRREALGWSQEELAASTGVARLWVSQIEQGKRTAEVGLVLQCLAALQLDIEVQPRTDERGKLNEPVHQPPQGPTRPSTKRQQSP
jgi:HTH-type transcriptional regulator / antitoxin HipB